MDLGFLNAYLLKLNLITWALVVFLCIVLFLLRWKLPVIIGRMGEKFVRGKLLNLNPEYYKVINNLTLPSSGSTTVTQIDHVVISNYGIFCIETKNYKGWIFGNAYDKYWTQVIYHYKKKFYNPIHQNFVHSKAIGAYVRPISSTVAIDTFVAFPTAEKLRITGTSNVGHMEDILQKILNYTAVILSDGDRDEIFEALQNANIHDKVVLKDHIREVKNIAIKS